MHVYLSLIKIWEEMLGRLGKLHDPNFNFMIPLLKKLWCSLEYIYQIWLTKFCILKILMN